MFLQSSHLLPTGRQSIPSRVTLTNWTLTLGFVYELKPPATAGGTWTESVLYSFNPWSTSSDANSPNTAGVTFRPKGVLYGATTLGGSLDAGTVYELTPPAVAGGVWTETILYSFQAFATDGQHPYASVVLGGDGTLLGTTLVGGTGLYGTVYRLSPPAAAPWTETILQNFDETNGGHPESQVLVTSVGGRRVILGTASDSFIVGALGVVFELPDITPGTEFVGRRTLWGFRRNCRAVR